MSATSGPLGDHLAGEEFGLGQHDDDDDGDDVDGDGEGKRAVVGEDAKEVEEGGIGEVSKGDATKMEEKTTLVEKEERSGKEMASGQKEGTREGEEDEEEGTKV